MFSLILVLLELYESEINCRIESFWDAGWGVALGDKLNGFVAETDNLYTMIEIANWLHQNAIKHFPDSDYAKNHEHIPVLFEIRIDSGVDIDSKEFEEAVERIVMDGLAGGFRFVS